MCVCVCVYIYIYIYIYIKINDCTVTRCDMQRVVNLLHVSAIFRDVFNEEKYING